MSSGARIAIILGSALIGMITAGQFIASLYHNHQALGPCLSLSSAFCLYPPLSFWHWLSLYGQDPRHGPIMLSGLMIFLFFMIMGVIIMRFIEGQSAGQSLMRGKSQSSQMTSQGGWGDKSNLIKSGLTHKEGIVWGRLNPQSPLDIFLSPKLLTCADMRPILVTGGTRSGKGRGIVVPSLLNWSWSCLIFDPKSELWKLTSGFRSSLGPTLFFNPLHPHTARFNPLAEISRGDRALSDIQKLVAILIEPGTGQSTPDFWDKQGAEMLAALIYHCLYSAPNEHKNLIGVKALSHDLDETCKLMLAAKHDTNQKGEAITHPYIEDIAKAYLSTHERGRKSVQMTVRSYLSWLSGPEIENALSTSDFRLGDLMAHKEPVSLYIQIAPSEIKALQPLLRLFFHLASSAFTTHIETDIDGRPKENALLLMLDEFPLLGKISFFEDVVRLSAGYGLKCLFIAQSLNDISRIYGPHNGFLDNSYLYVAFSALDPITRDKVSKLTGLIKDVRQSASLPHHFLDKSGTKTIAEIERPLLTPSEVGSLPDNEQLAFIAGHKPYKLPKLHYEKIEWLHERSQIPAPDQSRNLLTPELPSHPWLDVKPVLITNPNQHQSFEEKQIRPSPLIPRTNIKPPPFNPQASLDFYTQDNSPAHKKILDITSESENDQGTEHKPDEDNEAHETQDQVRPSKPQPSARSVFEAIRKQDI